MSRDRSRADRRGVCDGRFSEQTNRHKRERTFDFPSTSTGKPKTVTCQTRVRRLHTCCAPFNNIVCDSVSRVFFWFFVFFYVFFFVGPIATAHAGFATFFFIFFFFFFKFWTWPGLDPSRCPIVLTLQTPVTKNVSVSTRFYCNFFFCHVKSTNVDVFLRFWRASVRLRSTVCCWAFPRAAQ